MEPWVPIETKTAQSLLDQLLEESRLYRSGKDFHDLLDFVVRLRNFAPFNAMLLQVQKPGMLYAASQRDWQDRFERRIKDDARPLLILWPFGPVALVYDVADTEGAPLPEDVSAFTALGSFTEIKLLEYAQKLCKKDIKWENIDSGDGKAGSIRVISRPVKTNEPSIYKVALNRNHNPNVRFATLVHELGHLFLGHLGKDKYLNIPERRTLTSEQSELEAESVSYIVCARNGVKSKSQTYLSEFVKDNTATEDLDLYQIMRAAGQVETILDLGAHTQFDRPKKLPIHNVGESGNLFTNY